MDVWAESVQHRGGGQSLSRDQYNALGKLKLAAIQRIVSANYRRGVAFILWEQRGQTVDEPSWP
jgi:hypothetical protein